MHFRAASGIFQGGHQQLSLGQFDINDVGDKCITGDR